MKPKFTHVVFDRDGTLIKFIDYLSDPNQVELIPGVKEVFIELKKNNLKLFLHTNQSGVERGFFKLLDVYSCNKKMINLIGLGDDIFDAICIATDVREKKNSYRKPSPLFGNEIISNYGINKSQLLYVGDNITDLETAKNIRCMAFGVNYGKYNLRSKVKIRTDLNYPIFNTFLEVGKAILDI